VAERKRSFFFAFGSEVSLFLGEQAVEYEARLKGSVEDEKAKAEWKRLQGLIQQVP